MRVAAAGNSASPPSLWKITANVPRIDVLYRGVESLASANPAAAEFLCDGRMTGRGHKLPPGMPIWQDRLFIALAHSSSDASDFFQSPTGRVVEVGTQVTV